MGWTDFKYVDQENWFDPIRNDPAFVKLVKEWRGKGGNK
jgi:hypothetical protein